MLTAAVVRDERVRRAFDKIAWINLSQQPDLLQLQKRLYQQLHPDNEEMPKKASPEASQLSGWHLLKHLQSSVAVLKPLCVGQNILVVIGIKMSKTPPCRHQW